MENPVIVVVAYNRENSLKRLLVSLRKANYEGFKDITLVISIDKGNNFSVTELTNNFYWPFGQKKIIQRKHHLGLKRHIIECGNLTKQYGSIILLEDDLYVSPFFYSYTNGAVHFYANDDKIAGISLYNYERNEFANKKFEPVNDGKDVYFVKTASSWGQAWTKNQWSSFISWCMRNPYSKSNIFCRLPSSILKWPSKTSWKKEFIKYLVTNNKYFVFPIISLTTNFGEKGVNTTEEHNLSQVSLLVQQKRFSFVNIKDSLSIYDEYFEILPDCLSKLNPTLKKYDFEVDLYGIKNIKNISKEYIITSKSCSHPVLSYSSSLKPLCANIICNLPGEDLKLCKKSLINKTRWFDFKRLTLK